ncbi:MAG TPA: ferredoxin [Nitrososphaerales archaeon]|nr:ferredoxin [Nitrososphaerales archaeon]
MTELTSEQEEAERIVTLNSKAFNKLTWAKRKDENYSDVILRLVSSKLDGLQRRGDKEIVTRDNKRLILSIDQGVCMGAESCVQLAPEVFALDESNLGLVRAGGRDAPLAMRDVMPREIDSERIIEAARSCPYKAIRIVDAESGEEVPL